LGGNCHGNEWAVSLPGMKVVKVSVANVRVEHEVRLQNFTKWLEKQAPRPSKSARKQLREILGMGQGKGAR